MHINYTNNCINYIKILIDTELLYTEAFNRIINLYGKEFTWEHKAKIMGFKSKDVGQALIEMFSLPITVEEFENKITKIYQELFPSANLMPGNL